MADNINDTLSELNNTLGDLDLAALTEGMAACCQKQAGDVETPPNSGVPPIGNGKMFPTVSAFEDAKCRIANAIWQTVRGTTQTLFTDGVGLKLGAFGAATTTLIAALLVSGPLGWGIAAVGGSVIGILTLVFFNEALDLEVLLSELDTDQEDLINALYQASTPDAARTAFLTVMEESAVSLSPVEIQMAKWMIPYNLLNELFQPSDDLEGWEPDDPVECTELPTLWTVTNGTPKTPLGQVTIIVESVFVDYGPGPVQTINLIAPDIGSQHVTVLASPGWCTTENMGTSSYDWWYKKPDGFNNNGWGDPFEFISGALVGNSREVKMRSCETFSVTITTV